jgi:hypothetical protein
VQLDRPELGGEPERDGGTGLVGDEVVLSGVSVRVCVSKRPCAIPRGLNAGAYNTGSFHLGATGRGRGTRLLTFASQFHSRL